MHLVSLGEQHAMHAVPDKPAADILTQSVTATTAVPLKWLSTQLTCSKRDCAACCISAASVLCASAASTLARHSALDCEHKGSKKHGRNAEIYGHAAYDHKHGF